MTQRLNNIHNSWSGGVAGEFQNKHAFAAIKNNGSVVAWVGQLS